MYSLHLFTFSVFSGVDNKSAILPTIFSDSPLLHHITSSLQPVMKGKECLGDIIYC